MTIHAERDISYVLVSDGIQIGDGSGSCLSDLSRIEKLTIPDVYEEDNKKVISIGKYAFGKDNEYKCNIGELILSKNLLTIDSYAFYSSIIDNIIFPKSLNTIYERAFDSIRVKNISFENCHANVFHPDGFQFRWATFSNLILPNSIKELPTAFLWGATVQNFHIPASVVKINWAAFFYTYKFEKITSDSPNYVVHNGILYSSDYRTLIKYPSNCYIDILPTVTEISDCGGFAGFSHTNFVLKNKIRKFGFVCFGFCLSMITCDLSCSYATEIPSVMFYGCNKIEKIMFPKTVTSFSYNVFEVCRSLKSVIFPKNLKSISDSLKTSYLKDIYYCGVNNINIVVEGNPTIHVTSDYPYDTFLKRQVTDRSYICEEPDKPFFYDPHEIICTHRQIYYSNYMSIFMIYAIILLEDGK